MATSNITGIEVFNDADPNRAVVNIARIGGGAYRVTDLTSGTSKDFRTLAEAQTYGEVLADDATDKATAAYVAELVADINTRDARIKALEDQLATRP